MFLNIPDSVLEDAALTSSAKIIYGFLLSRKDTGKSQVCTMTAQQIADAVGLERTAIPRLVRVLEAQGLLKINSVLSCKNRPQYNYEALVKESV